MSFKKLITIAENQRKVYDTGRKDGQTEGYEKRNEEVAYLNAELEATLNGGDTGYKRHLEENIRQANSDFNAIKAKIIESGVEVADGTKTEEYAVKVGKVYDKGKQDAYDAFWSNAYAGYSLGQSWGYFFAGRIWSDKTFAPNFDIIPVDKGFDYVFLQNGISDLEAAIARCGIKFDLSKATSARGTFQNSRITVIPEIDLSNCSTVVNLCYGASQLVCIRKMTVSEKTVFSSSFYNCSKLVEMIVDGTIGQNGFNIQYSTNLSKASITSIINALSPTTSGLTVTLSKTAVNNAFTTDEWNALIATKTNWTISLV